MSFRGLALQRFSLLQSASKRQGQTPNRASAELPRNIYYIYITGILKRRESEVFFGLKNEGALQK